MAEDRTPRYLTLTDKPGDAREATTKERPRRRGSGPRRRVVERQSIEDRVDAIRRKDDHQHIF